MKSAIEKAIKGLKQFTIDDIRQITGCSEREILEVIETLNIKKLNSQYMLEKPRKKAVKPKNNGIAVKKKKPILPQNRKVSFKRAAINFMDVAQNKCSESTFKSYKCILNKHLMPFFDKFKAVEIYPANIDEFINLKLSEGLSRKSINNILKLLGSILEKALKDRYIPYNPARAVSII